jgi:hypothetical protein
MDDAGRACYPLSVVIRRPPSLLHAFVASLAMIVYGSAVVASGAGTVPSNVNSPVPLPDDGIDHSEQVGAPHAPRHEGAVSQREGRTVFAVAPFSALPLAVLPTVTLPGPDQIARRRASEPQPTQASVASASHRTSRGPPLLTA